MRAGFRSGIPDDVREALFVLQKLVRTQHPGGGMAAGYCVCMGQGKPGPACLALRWLVDRDEQLWDLER